MIRPPLYTISKKAAFLLNFERISRLVDLMKQRTLVGDGDLPLIRNGGPSPIDIRSQHEYRQFVITNASMQDSLRKQMTEEEIKVASAEYEAWFQEYLRS